MSKVSKKETNSRTPPAAKPVSLHPLKFEQAVDKLLRVPKRLSGETETPNEGRKKNR